MKQARFYAVRHAIPERIDGDPGIDIAKQQRAISGASWVVSTILEDTDSKHLAIFTSPKKRAIQTAQAMSQTEYLRDYLLGEVKIEQDLDEHGSLDWESFLSKIANEAILANSSEDMPSILLVTHAPAISRIPQLDAPNLRPLGINEFRTNITLAN